MWSRCLSPLSHLRRGGGEGGLRARFSVHPREVPPGPHPAGPARPEGLHGGAGWRPEQWSHTGPVWCETLNTGKSYLCQSKTSLWGRRKKRTNVRLKTVIVCAAAGANHRSRHEHQVENHSTWIPKIHTNTSKYIHQLTYISAHTNIIWTSFILFCGSVV